MPLDNATRKHFRSIGHQLSPVVMIASTLSENIHKEIQRALDQHELIKVKIQAPRDEKKAMLDSICAQSGAETVQLVGHIALLYKASPEPDPKLSNVLRHRKRS